MSQKNCVQLIAHNACHSALTINIKLYKNTKLPCSMTWQGGGPKTTDKYLKTEPKLMSQLLELNKLKHRFFARMKKKIVMDSVKTPIWDMGGGYLNSIFVDRKT